MWSKTWPLKGPIKGKKTEDVRYADSSASGFVSKLGVRNAASTMNTATTKAGGTRMYPEIMVIPMREELTREESKKPAPPKKSMLPSPNPAPPCLSSIPSADAPRARCAPVFASPSRTQ